MSYLLPWLMVKLGKIRKSNFTNWVWRDCLHPQGPDELINKHWIPWQPKRLVVGSKQNELNSANSALASANNANNADQSALNVAIESRNTAENDKANADRNRDKVKADNKDRPKEWDLIIDAKIHGQMPGRGWTDKDIDDVVAKGPADVAVDQRRPNKTDDKLGRNDQASAYGGPGK